MASSTQRTKRPVRLVAWSRRLAASLADGDTARWRSSSAHGRWQQWWLAWLATGIAVAEVNSKESRVGRELGGYCEGQEGNGASAWQLRGDNDVARTWRAEVAGGDRATTASPCTCGHALARTRGHGPAWAAGKRALPLKLFSKLA
jgi:hypothetical protein